MMMLAAAAVVAEASSTCMTSDSAVTITPSNITTASVDEQTELHHHQQPQQDSVDDVTEDNPGITSGTESQDWFATVDTKHSSSCPLSTNNDVMSTAKLPTGIELPLIPL